MHVALFQPVWMQQLNLQRLNAAWVSVIQLGLPHSIVQFAKKVTISSSVAVSRKGISHTELRSKRKGLHCMCFQCLVFIVKLQVCLTLFLTSLVASAQWRSEASARVLDDFARAHIACSRTLYAVCKLGTTALVPVNLLCRLVSCLLVGRVIMLYVGVWSYNVGYWG